MNHFINELNFGIDLSLYGIEGGFHTLKGKDKTSVQRKTMKKIKIKKI